MSDPTFHADGPLHGLRVIDLTRHMSGPYASLILGDYGADVIKVESMPRGDPSRRGGVHFLRNVSALYLTWNRNKRSICINLRDRRGVDLVRRMAVEADVFMENYRPGVADTMGLGWDDLKPLNDRLIYCSISAFGSRGPWSQRPGTDPVAQALSGVMSVTGARRGPPLLVGIPVADYTSALMAVQGVLLALVARATTGHGQRVEVSLLGSLLFGLTTRVAAYFATGDDPERWGSEHSQVVPYQAFRTSDGYAVAGVWVDDDWPQFCEAVGRPELADDERFVDNRARVDNREVLGAILEQEFAARPADEWNMRFEARGLLFAPVNRFSDVLESPQVAEMGYTHEYEHPVVGKLRDIAPVIELGDTPGAIRRPAPMLGEHTREVLSGLGVSEEELMHLQSDGVVAIYQATMGAELEGDGSGPTPESERCDRTVVTVEREQAP